MKRIDRIREMEECFDTASEAALSAENALEKLEEADKAYKKLIKYYESGMWLKDFEADEAGKLPPDLKRGVLSEDGVWELTQRYAELKVRMRELSRE